MPRERRSLWGSIYKDPKWQKKRLEIMNKKGFRCEWCNSDKKELNVHHINYLKGKKPWEYEDHQFMVLCNEDHKKFHQFLTLFGTSLSILNKKNRQNLVNFICRLVDEQED